VFKDTMSSCMFLCIQLIQYWNFLLILQRKCFLKMTYWRQYPEDLHI
jgi:hypothetical protein